MTARTEGKSPSLEEETPRTEEEGGEKEQQGSDKVPQSLAQEAAAPSEDAGAGQAEDQGEKSLAGGNEADTGAWVRAIGSESLRITTLNRWPVGQRGPKPKRSDLVKEVERRGNSRGIKVRPTNWTTPSLLTWLNDNRPDSTVSVPALPTPEQKKESTIQTRWSVRFVPRLFCAVGECKDAWFNQFKRKTREELDDKQGRNANLRQTKELFNDWTWHSTGDSYLKERDGGTTRDPPPFIITEEQVKEKFREVAGKIKRGLKNFCSSGNGDGFEEQADKDAWLEANEEEKEKMLRKVQSSDMISFLEGSPELFFAYQRLQETGLLEHSCGSMPFETRATSDMTPKKIKSEKRKRRSSGSEEFSALISTVKEGLKPTDKESKVNDLHHLQQMIKFSDFVLSFTNDEEKKQEVKKKKRELEEKMTMAVLGTQD